MPKKGVLMLYLCKIRQNDTNLYHFFMFNQRIRLKVNERRKQKTIF